MSEPSLRRSGARPLTLGISSDRTCSLLLGLSGGERPAKHMGQGDALSWWQGSSGHAQWEAFLRMPPLRSWLVGPGSNGLDEALSCGSYSAGFDYCKGG